MRKGNYFITRDGRQMIDMRTIKYYEVVNIAGGKGKCCAVNGRGSATQFEYSDCDDFISAFNEFAEGKNESG